MSNQEYQATPTFEEALSQLEAIIESLEAGNTPLEQLIQQYEQGVRLLETCRTKLGEAELRIQKIEKSKDGFALSDIDVQS
jgi:exodeoxyribonuclease VII small subunit